MKQMKRILPILLVIAAMIVAGCGSSDTGSGKVYCLLHDNADAGFQGDLKRAIVNRLQAAGIETEVVDAKGDANVQHDQIKQAIDAKASAIVLAAVDGEAVIPEIEKANAAGIPIIRINRDISGGKFFSSVSDDREAGRMQGEFMAKNLPQGAKIVYMNGEMTQSGAKKRWEGFKESCLDKRPDIQLLASADCSWSEVVALRQMSLWLKLFPQIDGVVGANDDMALGAIRALRDAGRLEGVLVSGVDATDAALQAVSDGTMSQTVKQDAEGQGEGAFALIQAVRQGNKQPEDILVPFVEITKANIGQFLH